MKLNTIQALRAYAAIAVVFHHVAGQIRTNLGEPPMLAIDGIGSIGVQLFFAISGFIIIYAHRNDETGMAQAANYIWKRVTRILPSTIIVASGWAIVTIAASKAGLGIVPVDLRTWISSAFVLPMIAKPAPVVI